jgi:hypothetical protein
MVSDSMRVSFGRVESGTYRHISAQNLRSELIAALAGKPITTTLR